MRLYFSGLGSWEDSPEVLLADRQPHVMPSFYAMREGGPACEHVYAYFQQRRNGASELYGRTFAFGSLFVDSGAYSMRGKYPDSWFTLKKGSDFRRYCDEYADWIKRQNPGKRVMGVANVDVIGNAEKTWQAQRYFEEEHGVKPIPVVHVGARKRDVDRYLETGRYRRLGVGGVKYGGGAKRVQEWLDRFFRYICPASNGFLPEIRVHGFAITSLRRVVRYPWWSVDSTVWLQQANFGWIYVPRWSKKREDWDFAKPPTKVNFSWRSPEKFNFKKRWHYLNLNPLEKERVDRWLQRLELNAGTIAASPEEVLAASSDEEFSLARSKRARFLANLHYFKDLEESRPPWPYPLDPQIVGAKTMQKNGANRSSGKIAKAA